MKNKQLQIPGMEDRRERRRRRRNKDRSVRWQQRTDRRLESRRRRPKNKRTRRGYRWMPDNSTS
jgi:hypothetical protein